jgi:hypothetical protein
LRDEQSLHHNVHAEEIAAAQKQVDEAQKVYDAMLKASGSASQIVSAFASLVGYSNQIAANMAAAAAARLAIPLAPVPAPTAHQHGGIVIRPHVGLVGEAGPEAIIPVKKAGAGFGASITINAPVTINGTAGSQSDLGAFLAENAKEIAYQVQRVLAIQYENEAVV